MVTRITMAMLMTVVVDYWMMKMIIMMIMIYRAIAFKILVRTMLLVKADLLRKVIGVCVPLDLRVRFAKEVNTTIMLIS